MLDERQYKAIALLVENQYKKTDIADIVGVSRQAVYDWCVFRIIRTAIPKASGQ